MNKLLTSLIAIMAGMTLVQRAFPAATDVLETWDSGTAGWVRYDALNDGALSLVNTSQCLSVVFVAQSMAMPEASIVRAETNSSGGVFAGDYLSAGVTNVAFKFRSETCVPARLGLYFHSGGSGDWWFYPLPASEPGTWTQYDVPMDCWKGWQRDAGVAAGLFRSDTASNDWVGVLIERNGSIARQVYALDDFVLRGVANRTVDSDHDGMSDWNEFLAGSDPLDPQNRLWVELSQSNGLIVVKWKSVEKRVYGVWRSGSLLASPWPEKIATGVQATPPTNAYIDESTGTATSYYYRIQMEE